MVQLSILVLIRECKQFIFNHAMIDIREKDKELNMFVSLSPVYFEQEKKLFVAKKGCYWNHLIKTECNNKH